MNTRSSNYTGRVHRTMDSAFGPYTSHDLHGPADRINARGNAAVVVVSIAGLCVFAGLFIAGVL